MHFLSLVIAWPLLGALIALVVPSNRVRPWVMVATGVGHTCATAAAMAFGTPPVSTAPWLGLDALNRVVLGQVSLLFLICALYAPGYLSVQARRDNRTFVAMCQVFLAMVSLAVTSRHLGLMWAGIEAATVSTASLIHFNHNPRSIEATWKYLLIGSVGITMALLGSLFLAYSALHGGLESTLFFDDLLVQAPLLSPPWLHTALVLLFVGYGTKMGLAPMHTWKPDAYGEAPGIVGTLLAGAMTSAAFMALLRFVQIGIAAGEGPFTRTLLVTVGLFSMAVAGVFMVGQADFKRMLAYSSVEHMGILVFGVGLGGAGVFGALYHMLTNAFTKGAMFLSAGNIHRAYGSKRVDEVRGALARTPISAGLFLIGFFAVTGAPPFGPFMSEFTILVAAVDAGRLFVAGLFLLLLFVVFMGMGTTVLAVVQGEPPDRPISNPETFRVVAPGALFLAISLLLGLWLPAPVYDALTDAAAFVEGRP